ncbi:universal stress protein [Pseudomonas aeruginosa]|nr:universal stress protein [Pseudomonas aeruginosa]
MKRILVATDLSSRSELAVMRAAALAKARNAELTVLNVLDDDQPPVLIAPQRLAIANLLEVNGQALKERLGVESKAIVRVGDPVVVINAVAEEIGADLLVMGAHRPRRCAICSSAPPWSGWYAMRRSRCCARPVRRKRSTAGCCWRWTSRRPRRARCRWPASSASSTPPASPRCMPSSRSPRA